MATRDLMPPPLPAPPAAPPGPAVAAVAAATPGRPVVVDRETVHREGRLEIGSPVVHTRIDGRAGTGATGPAVAAAAAIPASAARRLVVAKRAALNGQGCAELDDRAALTDAPVTAASSGATIAAGAAQGPVAGE